jgi:hypothetical protein
MIKPGPKPADQPHNPIFEPYRVEFDCPDRVAQEDPSPRFSNSGIPTDSRKCRNRDPKWVDCLENYIHQTLIGNLPALTPIGIAQIRPAT